MKRKILLISLIMLGTGQSVVYADGGDASKQLQMLNSQIQVQLQQIQENQQKHDKAFNTQIQGQMKKLQVDIQKQITDSFNKTQEQIKTVQNNLQKEIKQLNENINKSKQIVN